MEVDADDGFIIDYVEESVRKHPSSIAIIAPDYKNGSSVTYIEMWTKVMILSQMIRRHFKNSQALDTPLVSIMMNRGIGAVVCILGVLKGGAAYVPIDPTHPTDRQEYILKHSKSELILLGEDIFPFLQAMDQIPVCIVVNSQTGEVLSNKTYLHCEESPSFTIKRRDSAKTRAYVLYTSGSTGSPKGVMVHNKGLTNVIRYFANYLEVCAMDRVLGLTTFCFDISMLELFVPLISGATLVIVSAKTQTNPFRILEVLRDHKLTIMQATPTTYELLMSCDWNGDANIHFLVGGEVVRHKVAQLAINSRSLTNVYGPTETTIYSLAYRIPSIQECLNTLISVPIGSPIESTFTYVVDENMKLVPEGQLGELLIGGDGVALGYINAPELTDKRFFANPFGDPGRVYRTGDLVSKLPDGNYTFAGRLDDQVKINGCRIELGEVEYVLAKHWCVSQAAVIVKDNQLIAYVSLKASLRDSTLCSEKFDLLLTEIKQFVGKAVPSYMLPRHIISIDSIPTNSNGKLDKLALGRLPVSHAAERVIVSTSEESSEFESISDNSMETFVLQKVFEVSSRRPLPCQSFAAVGVDSLAAASFRSLLSASLGGVRVAPDKLYDAATSITSFSCDLYDQLLLENPRKLQDLNIRHARPVGSDADKPMIRNNLVSTSRPCLDVILLASRRLFDGLRGMLIVLVLYDHLFNDTRTSGVRIRSDTYMFVVLTAISITMQSLAHAESYEATDNDATITRGDTTNSNGASNNSWISFIASCVDDFVSMVKRDNARKPSPWSASHFLATRWMGIFPIYWCAILLSIPEVLSKLYSDDVPPSEVFTLYALYILAIKTWTCWGHKLMANLYFVGYIWGVLLLYAVFMSNYYSPFSIFCKLLGFVISVITVVVSYLYACHWDDGSHIQHRSPAAGFFYFTLGTVITHIFNHVRLHIIHFDDSMHTHISTSAPHKTPAFDDAESELLLPGPLQGENKLKSVTKRRPPVQLPLMTTYDEDDNICDEENECELVNQQSAYSLGLSRQAMSSSPSTQWTHFLINNLTKKSSRISFAYITRFGCKEFYWALLTDASAFFFFFLMFFNHYSTPGMHNPQEPQYKKFDGFMYEWGFAIYFSIFTCLCLMNPFNDSIFTFLAKETFLPQLLGECSLPIYLYHQMIIGYYIPTVRCSVETGVNMFNARNTNTIPCEILTHSSTVWTWIGIVASVIFCVFMQRIFQEKWIMTLYIWMLRGTHCRVN